MKKILAYLLLLSLLIISVSACGSKEDTRPLAPTEPTLIDNTLRADAGAANVTLDWQMVGSGATYNIYYIPDPGSPPDAAQMRAGTKIPDVISAPCIIPLTPETKYYFAFEVGGIGMSPIIEATPSANPVPATPKNVRANAGNKSVTITWDTVPNATSYFVYCYRQDGLNVELGRIAVPGGQPSHQQVIDDANPITLWDGVSQSFAGSTTGLTNEQTYYFWVSAVNASGENASFRISATPSTTPPPWAPVLTAATKGAYTIDSDSYNTKITWNAPVTGTAASYNIYIGTARGVTKETGDVTNVTPSDPLESYADLGSGTYYIVVTAVDASAKESAESKELSVTIP